MSLASIAFFMLVAGSAAPAPAGHGDHLAHGRSVVETMLLAVARQDGSAFARVVEKDALLSVGRTPGVVELQIPPAEFGCANPRVTKVEASDNVVGDSKVTVAWTCKPRRPDFDGNLAIRFWVHGGKVIFGERV